MTTTEALTTAEVAKIVKFSEYQVREWARQNAFDRKLRKSKPRGIEGAKVRNQWRFTEKSVNKFLEGKK